LRLPELPECRSFGLEPRSINVRPEGDSISLTVNRRSFIKFAPRAVSQNTTFNVSPVTDSGGKRLAGAGFTPATGRFPQPVLLHIDFSGCPDIVANKHRDLHIEIRDAGGSWKSIGGFVSEDDNFVEALVPHFTDFAIAL
jgi:hypothetical protein